MWSAATLLLVPVRHRSVRPLLCKSQIFIRGGVPQGHDNLLCKSQIFIRGGVPQGHDYLPCDRSRRSDATIAGRTWASYHGLRLMASAPLSRARERGWG